MFTPPLVIQTLQTRLDQIFALDTMTFIFQLNNNASHFFNAIWDRIVFHVIVAKYYLQCFPFRRNPVRAETT